MKVHTSIVVALSFCILGSATLSHDPSENEVLKEEGHNTLPDGLDFRKGKSSNAVLEEYTRISNTKARLKLQDIMMRNTIRKFLQNDPAVAALKGIFIVKGDEDKTHVEEMLGREEDMEDEKIFNIVTSDVLVSKLLDLNEHSSKMKAVLLVREERAKKIIQVLLEEYKLEDQIMVVSTFIDSKSVELINGLVNADKKESPVQDLKEDVKEAEKAEKAEESAILNIKGFLETENHPTSLGGLFIVKDTDAKLKIEKLIAQDGIKYAVKDLRLVQLDKAADIIARHAEKDDSLKGVSTILIVKDGKAKAIIEDFMRASKMKNEVMTVVKTEGSNADKIIDDLLNIPLTNDSSEKAEMEAPKLVSRKDDRVRKLMEELLGQDYRLMEILELFPHLDKKVRATLQEMLGHDDKVRAIMEELSARNTLRNPGFLSQQERGKNILDKLYGKDDRGREVNDGLVDADIDTRRCATATYKNATHKTRDELEGFVQHLQRKFLLETVFDFVGFENSGKALEMQLWELETKVAAVMVCDRDLAYQLAFAQHMFQAMTDAVELLKYYAGIEMSAHHLVYSIIDLSIRLLGLRNINGDPDSSMDGYAIKVKQFVQMLHFWSGEFTNYKEVPFAMQKTFQKYSSQAEKNLLILAQHLAQKQNKGFQFEGA